MQVGSGSYFNCFQILQRSDRMYIARFQLFCPLEIISWRWGLGYVHTLGVHCSLEDYNCPLFSIFWLRPSGIGQFVSQFAEPGEPEYAPPVTKGETPVSARSSVWTGIDSGVYVRVYSLCAWLLILRSRPAHHGTKFWHGALCSQAQRRARIHLLRLEKGAEKAASELEKCKNMI